MSRPSIKWCLAPLLLLSTGQILANAVVDQSFEEKIRNADLVIIGEVKLENGRLKGNEYSRYATIRTVGVLSKNSGDAGVAVGEDIVFVYRWGSAETDIESCCKRGEKYILFLKRATGRRNAFISSNGPYGAYLLVQPKPGDTH